LPDRDDVRHKAEDTKEWAKKKIQGVTNRGDVDRHARDFEEEDNRRLKSQG
jgi:hypothetical protein